MLPDGIQEFRPALVDDLAPAERNVIEFMLQEGPRSWTLSSRGARREGRHQRVTVVRAAQALGYSKLGHLRLALADYWPETTQPRLDERLEATLETRPTASSKRRSRSQSPSSGRSASRSLAKTSKRRMGILDRSQRIVWRGVGPSAFWPNSPHSCANASAFGISR